MKLFSTKRITCSVLLALSLAATGMAQAANTVYNWSGPGGTTTAPTSGTWDTTSLNWNNGANAWISSTGTTSTTSSGTFGGTTAGNTTVTLSGSIIALDISFTSTTDTYTITGGQTITLTTNVATDASGAIQVLSGVTADIAAGTTISYASSSGTHREEISGAASGAGGTLNVSGTITNSVSIVDISGGVTVNLLSGGVMNVNNLQLNNQGTNAATLSIQGGTLTAGVIGVGDNANAGTVGNLTGTATLIVGAGGSGGVVNSLTATLAVAEGKGKDDGQLILDATGTVQAQSITGSGSGGGVSSLFFNGGTLKATTTAETNFIALNTATGSTQQFAYVGGNASTANSGVVIDNDGSAIGTSQAFVPGNGMANSTNASGTIDGGLTSLGAGTLTLRGASTYTGTTTVSAGTLQAGVATVGGASPTSGAFGVNSAMVVTTGATLDLNGFNETVGSLSGTGGTVTSSAAIATTLTSGGSNASTSYAGVIQDGSGLMSFNKIGTGTQTFSGANTYSGGTTISGGNLRVTNTSGSGTGTGTVQVNSGGTLGGNGTINTSGVSSGNAIDIASGGTLSPSNGVTSGFSHLNLTLQSGTSVNLEAGSKLAFNLGATTASSDEVLVTGGSLTLNGQDFSDFTFNVTGTASGTYTLIDSAGGITGLGTTLTGTFGGGYTGTLFISGNDLDLTVTGVPEPGTWALMLGGLTLLVLIQRRRSKRDQI